MIEPVNAEEFISQPERRKPEQFQHVKLRIDGGVARMTLSRPEHNLLNEANTIFSMKPCCASWPTESRMLVNAMRSN